jgi:uncharacterized protein (UPF0335 family)
MIENTNGNIDTTRLNSFIDRIERLETEKKNLAEDLKEVYGEAKAAGYEIKALKAIIKLKMASASEKNKIDEEKYWIEIYKNALGI